MQNEQTGFFESITNWFSNLLVADVDEDETFDERWVKSLELAYIETNPVTYPEKVRCNLCGKLFDEMESCVKHVGNHDDDGDAAIDPFYNDKNEITSLRDDSGPERPYRSPVPISDGLEYILPPEKRQYTDEECDTCGEKLVRFGGTTKRNEKVDPSTATRWRSGCANDDCEDQYIVFEEDIRSIDELERYLEAHGDQ